MNKNLSGPSGLKLHWLDLLPFQLFNLYFPKERSHRNGSALLSFVDFTVCSGCISVSIKHTECFLSEDKQYEASHGCTEADISSDIR